MQLNGGGANNSPTFVVNTGKPGSQLRVSTPTASMAKDAPFTTEGFIAWQNPIEHFMGAMRITANATEYHKAVKMFPYARIGKQISLVLGLCSLYCSWKAYDSRDLFGVKDLVSTYYVRAMGAAAAAADVAKSAIKTAEALFEDEELVAQLKKSTRNNQQATRDLHIELSGCKVVDFIPRDDWASK